MAKRGYRPQGALLDAAAAREAPDKLAAVHRAYIDAGADVISAFTERTTVRALARGGLGMRAAALTHRAVDIALEEVQRSGRSVAVAGVLGPLEDGSRTPSARTLADEHTEQAGRLAATGCSLMIVDAMSSLAESLAATSAARTVFPTVWTTLAIRDRAHLVDGTRLDDAATFAAAVGAQVLLLESASVTELVAAAMHLASMAIGVPLGFRSAPTDESFERLAGELSQSLPRGVRVVGGSRAATSEFVRALSPRIHARVAA